MAVVVQYNLDSKHCHSCFRACHVFVGLNVLNISGAHLTSSFAPTVTLQLDFDVKVKVRRDKLRFLIVGAIVLLGSIRFIFY